jgi:phage FluMu protein Com
MKLTFRCVECSQKLNIASTKAGSAVTCPACGAVQAVSAPLAKRFRVLRATVVVLQVVAAVVTVSLLVAVLIAVGHGGEGHSVMDNVLLLGVGIPASLLVGLLIYALGEGIGLLIDLEENTRATRQLLELARSEQKSAPANNPG